MSTRNRTEYHRRYHQENRLRRGANAKIRGYTLTAALRWFKQGHPCADCGETDPIVLQFDHVRGVKRFSIGHQGSHSLETIWIEIQKCDVVCANCHARRTASRHSANGSAAIGVAPGLENQ